MRELVERVAPLFGRQSGMRGASPDRQLNGAGPHRRQQDVLVLRQSLARQDEIMFGTELREQSAMPVNSPLRPL